MALDHAEHKIGANSLLFGVTNFLTLTLPADWLITRSYLQPDVRSNIKRDNLAWVGNGQIDQIVFHPTRKVALDLTIIIKRGKKGKLKSKGVAIHSQGSLMIHGHEASYYLGEVGIGFLKRKRGKTLQLCFHCSDLERTIMISFTGYCQEADIQEIFESLSGSRCH
jgi:hypothetical protein